MKLLVMFFSLLVLVSNAQALVFDSNVPDTVKTQMLGDLDFIASVQAPRMTPLGAEIFGQLKTPVLRTWFEGRVRSVGLNSCGGNGAVACVMPFYDSSKMWLTENYTRFNHPQVARLMVVYHESRHTEDSHSNWYHANCPKPFIGTDGKEIRSIWTGEALAGKPGCDISPYGSYGSSTILMKNIAKFCSNCNEKVKMDADLYADDQLKRIIDAGAKDKMLRDFSTP